MTHAPRVALALTWLSAAGAAIASIVTLTWAGSFPSPEPAPQVNVVLAEARGWSIAMLAVAVPVLVAAATRAQQGSLRGHLVWLGALAYMVYSYLEFSVAPPFTPLFLVYVVTFSSALVALVSAAACLDLGKVAGAFRGSFPRGGLVAFSLLVGSFLAFSWLKGIIEAMLGGGFGWLAGDAAVRHVVYALDLGLQVPLALSTGVLLLRRQREGLVVAAIFLVNAVCMGTALFAMVLSASVAAGTSPLIAVPFALLPAVAFALSWFFFRAIVAGAADGAFEVSEAART